MLRCCCVVVLCCYVVVALCYFVVGLWLCCSCVVVFFAGTTKREQCPTTGRVTTCRGE